MNTYYTFNISEAQRECLLSLGRNQIIWKNAVAANAWDALKRQVEEAEAHPNIDDVYLHDAQHSGFTAGEKVLLECSVVATSNHVSTLSVRHLAAVKGEEIMVANNLIHHMEPEA